jgi:HEAT repeat protein
VRVFVLLLALASILRDAAIASPPDPPRLYDGRTLEHWRSKMKELDPNSPASAAAVPGLVAIVEDADAPWFTRRQAAQTLGRMGTFAARETVPVLIARLDEESSDEQPTRLWAIRALALFQRDARDAAPALIRVLRDESATLPERSATLETLARIGPAHRHAVPAIIEVLKSPADSSAGASGMRELAAEALTLVGPAAAEAVPALMRSAREPEERLRRKSVEALGAMGPGAEIAVPLLAEAMVLDESAAARDAAAAALAAVGEPALPVLTHLLSDEDSEARRRAASALARMGTRAKPALKPLQTALADDHPEVRIEAADALWKITADAGLVLPALVKELTTEDRQVRIRALRLLTSMGRAARPALGRLRALLNDERPWVRQAAEMAIERIDASVPHENDR